MGKQDSWPCGCFRKVYVCPEHLLVFEAELEGLTGQLELPILDSVVSVSALVGTRGTSKVVDDGIILPS